MSSSSYKNEDQSRKPLKKRNFSNYEVPPSEHALPKLSKTNSYEESSGVEKHSQLDHHLFDDSFGAPNIGYNKSISLDEGIANSDCNLLFNRNIDKEIFLDAKDNFSEPCKLLNYDLTSLTSTSATKSESEDCFSTLLALLEPDSTNSSIADITASTNDNTSTVNTLPDASISSAQTEKASSNPTEIIDLTKPEVLSEVIDLTNNEDADVQVEFVTKIVPYPQYLADFVIKHAETLSVFDTLFKSVSFKLVSKGVELSGSCFGVDQAYQCLRELTWFEARIDLSCPQLKLHFNCDTWKDFVKVLQNETRCAIDVECCEDEIELEQNKVSELHYPSIKDVGFESINTNFEPNTILSPKIDYGYSIPSTYPFYSQSMVSPGIPMGFKNVPQTTSVSYRNLKVVVCTGDITDDDSMVIVNGVSPSFDLARSGMVSNAILRKGGQEIATAFQLGGMNPTLPPFIRVTNGFNLRCNFIIHVATPQRMDEYTDRTLSVLNVANQLKAESIALPSIGLGGNNLDPVQVAQNMARAFDQFSMNALIYLKTIKVILFQQNLMNIFISNIIYSKELSNFGYNQVLELENKLKSNSKSNKATIRIKSDKKEVLCKARERIEKHLDTCIGKRPIENDLLVKLGDHDCIDIYEASQKHHAEIEYTEDDKKQYQGMVLKGLKDNINALHNDIRELWFELKMAETQSKICVWKWAIGMGNFVDLPCRVSHAIEKIYENNCKGQGKVRLLGKEMHVNLTTMQYQFGKYRGSVKRCDVNSTITDLPSEWVNMNGRPMVRVILHPTSSEYADVLSLFMKSKPMIQTVFQIERIQNPALYRQYRVMFESVSKHLIKSNNPVERKLFHGTSEEDANKICAFGFDRGFAGKNATAFGKGSYFAVDSSYSVGFAKAGPAMRRYMFLAQVLTGDFAQGRSDMRAPPEKYCRLGDRYLYDSVVDKLLDPKMFVVFKDSSVYPSYLITFM